MVRSLVGALLLVGVVPPDVRRTEAP